MPGIIGLETLSRIKTINKDIPVVMITKNEGKYYGRSYRFANC